MYLVNGIKGSFEVIIGFIHYMIKMIITNFDDFKYPILMWKKFDYKNFKMNKIKDVNLWKQYDNTISFRTLKE